MTKPTNEELIADMLAIYHELGYLTASTYAVYGLHHSKIPERRFGSWSNACKIANIPLTRKSKRLIEMITTTCLSCDEWFDRPQDDKSCRLCKVCRRNRHYIAAVSEGWEVVAAG